MKHIVKTPIAARQVLLWLSVVTAVWSLLPLVNGIVNGVVLLPSLVLGAAWLFVRTMPPFRKAKGWRKGMWMAAIAVAMGIPLEDFKKLYEEDDSIIHLQNLSVAYTKLKYF